MKAFKKGIAVVGSTTIDEIVDNSRSFFKLGGVTTYSGITYRRHGINTLVVSNVAEPDLAMLETLYHEKIVVCRGKSRHSTRFVNYIKGDSRTQKLQRQAEPIRSMQIKEILDQVDSLHLGPLYPLDIDWEAADLLRNSNRLLFLDIQGLTRMQRNRRIYTSISEHMERALDIAHIVKASEAEYDALLDFFRMDPMELIHRFNLSEMVVTSGEKGGFVQNCSGDKYVYQAHRIESPPDPTGAGDVFFAAYLVGRYADKKDIADACRYAARIAAQQVEGKYITADMLRLE